MINRFALAALSVVALTLGAVLFAAHPASAAEHFTISIVDGEIVPEFPPSAGFPYSVSGAAHATDDQPSSVAGLDYDDLPGGGMSVPLDFTGVVRFLASFPEGEGYVYLWFEDGHPVSVRNATGAWGSSASGVLAASADTVSHAVETAGDDMADTLGQIALVCGGLLVTLLIPVVCLRFARSYLGGS